MLQQRIKKNILLFTTMLSASLIFLFGVVGVGETKIEAFDNYDLMNQMNQSIQNKINYTVSLAIDKMRSASEVKHGKAARSDIENLYSGIYSDILEIPSWSEDNITEFDKVKDIDDTKTLQPLINSLSVYLINSVIVKLKADPNYSDLKTYIDEMSSSLSKEVNLAISTLWYPES
ncbi:hypothetical protein C6B37_00040 [Candidatus Phytoplasma phoenicium]|uniref:Uncharacterized protein n=1 Tax=Candidatus Phytoplasma phoenicium TaxID=198422 RepID=A0A2S8NVG8_9MOLU|nr:hypothetical protein C6B37_00040 [Candidatus Phytoplasma phoenicium]